MSIIVVDNQIVHYEVFGRRGPPVLFLHGWLGSWRYWFPTIEAVATSFRTYSFDFWGFGDSRNPSAAAQQNIENYSYQIIRFLDEMGLYKVALVGHSMGGMVALKTAISHPQRVTRVITVGAPFQGHALSWLLKLTNKPGVANLFARWHWLRRTLFHFFMGETRDPSVEEVVADSLKSTAVTMRCSIRSMLQTDLRPELQQLSIPALIIHGGRDDIVDPRQLRLFEQIESARTLLMPTSRHFPFVDQPDFFTQILLSFLQQDVSATMPRLVVRENSKMS
ncbi:MAG: alpha/beta hydrolase [Chloroflexaceae bacterium]|nr:alpha/beta hydrolase [Chloroflexaceae bacterium]